jgi:hypothetical protein
MRKATPANNTILHQQIPNHMLHHPRSAMRESSSQRGGPPSHNARAAAAALSNRQATAFAAFFGFFQISG